MSGFVIRPARRSDCREIARLFLMSSDGLAEYIWSQLPAGPGETLIDVGERRYAREGVDFSYRNCLLAGQGGRIAGMLHSFPMAAPDGAAAPAPDPVLRPYAELEDHGSLYVSGLAVHPFARGSGIGTALLAAADARAAALGLPRVSLICFEANEGAMRLYRRLGFRAIARRALVPHPMLHYAAGDAVLMARDVAANGANAAILQSATRAA